MSESIFFSNVPSEVQSVLNARKNVYSKTVRGSNDFTWLAKKMAYATATANNEKSGRSASLNLSEAGGIGSDGLYKGGTYDGAQGGRWMPKPHLNSVKITTDGDLGSLRKCSIAFSVFTLNDLDNYQAFFDIGGKLTVKYGWNGVSSGLGGRQGSFEGIIYNFTYTVNANGGFDCTSEATAEGLAAIASNSNASYAHDQTFEDEAGFTRIANNLSSELEIYSKKAKKESPNHNSVTVMTGTAGVAVRIGIIEYATDWGAAEKKEESDKEKKKFDVNDETGPKHGYIMLESLILLINTLILQKAGGNKFKSIRIICNKNVTRSAPPANRDDLVSADPTKIIFPGYGLYGTRDDGFVHNLSFDKSEDDVANLSSGRLNSVYLSIDWLLTLLPKQGEKSDDREKSTDTSISKLITNICDAIKDLSGGRFQLSLAADPTSTKTEKNYIITDPSFINVNEKVTPYTITALTNNSICRNISLSSKVPAGFAAAAYVGNASPTNESNASAPNNSVETDSNTQGDATNNPFVALELAKKVLNASGVTEPNVGALKAALRRVFTYSPTGAAPYANALPFPLDFSVTLDGIEGFRFGNAIDTNYLPSVYRNNGTKTAFTVTKIEHSIEGNDWSTTLSTVCRILPGKNSTNNADEAKDREAGKKEAEKLNEASQKAEEAQKLAEQKAAGEKAYNEALADSRKLGKD